jgi:hypothetical protein
MVLLLIEFDDEPDSVGIITAGTPDKTITLKKVGQLETLAGTNPSSVCEAYFLIR